MFKFKNHFNDLYQPSDAFLVRNPLFPVERFFTWMAGDGDTVIAAKETLRKSLCEFYQQPIVQEALYLASPDLHEQLQLWLETQVCSTEPDPERALRLPKKHDKIEKTELSLVKYMIRMCTRCTPYGLFASCTVGNFSGSTSLELSGKESIYRYGRLDMDYVCQLYIQLLKQKEIIDQLLFFPNTSLYRCGDQWRYVEHRFAKDTGRSYHLVEIDNSICLEKIINACANGKKTSELAALTRDVEITNEDAFNFIYELIYAQVLVNELTPFVTGEEYFNALLRKLKTLQVRGKDVEQLEKVAGLFDQLRTEHRYEPNNIYQLIVRELQALEAPVNLKTLIQVDSYRPTGVCSLNRKVHDEVLKGISLLELLTPDKSAKDTFTEFKTAFINRYEDEFMPLAEVLDTESGIGYGKFSNSGMEESPLVDKLPIRNDARVPATLPDTEDFKWQLYHQAVSENKIETVIPDKVIEQLANKDLNATALPDSFYIMVNLNASSGNEIDNGNYTLGLQSPYGPSGANLLGRFCHLHPEIERLVRETLEEEEHHRPDCIFAEIVHLPESRTGNVIMRPILRKYEIAYLCGTSLNKEFQIPVSDLLVGIDNNKVVLRSQKLNKEIVPRLTTAHNYHLTTLPVYQFLCDLQHQGVRQIGWQWGALEASAFLPRVRYGRFILSKARWVLTKEDISDFENQADDELLSQFVNIMQKKNLPDYVQLAQGDNELSLHLKNVFCLRLLLAEINKNNSVILREAGDTPGQCWIKSTEGRHAGEFIFTFSRKKGQVMRPVPDFTAQQKQLHVKRRFPVGSEWLYAKIYCGTKTAEKLLVDVLKPFTEALLAKRLIDKFFFIRYNDTGHHIRVRFHNSVKKGFWKGVMTRLHNILKHYFENKTVNNLQFETYSREVERYGFDTIHLSENVFFFHSQAVLNFISLLDGDSGEQYRWQVGLKAIDIILEDFCYDLERKHSLVTALNKNFSAEFKVSSGQRKKISEQFSGHRELVNILMSEGWREDVNLSKAINVLKIQNVVYASSVTEILNAPSLRGNRERLDEIVSSYLHMFINRLFVSNQRKTEFIIYEYLWKYYHSKMIREKENHNLPKAISSVQ